MNQKSTDNANDVKSIIQEAMDSLNTSFERSWLEMEARKIEIQESMALSLLAIAKMMMYERYQDDA